MQNVVFCVCFYFYLYSYIFVYLFIYLFILAFRPVLTRSVFVNSIINNKM